MPKAKTSLWKIPSIDYTSRDFQSIRDDLIRTIPFYTPEWTDYNPSDLGIVILELLSHMGDVVHYYIDRMAAESFLPTAVTRRSVTNLLKLIDYELRGKVAASVDLKFTLAQPLPGPLTIPALTKVKTLCDRPGSQSEGWANNIYFETMSDLIIPAGALEGIVGAKQGKTSKDVLVATSDGLANQKYAIPEKPVIEGTLRLFVDEGIGPEEWAEVDTLIEKQSCDKCFLSFRDDKGVVWVQFGDNAQGKIPDAGANIYGTYRIGGGSEGNVGAGTITILETSILFAGSPVTLSVTNEKDASGGEDEQSIESARLEGPRTLRALYRAVTAEDFESLSEVFPGVAKAKAVAGHWRDSNKSSCCMISIFIVPAGGGLPSTQLKLDLTNYLNQRKIECLCVEVFNPRYQPVDIRGEVIVYSNFNVMDVREAILARLNAYFDETESPYTGFDRPAYLSDIISIIDGTDGVDHVNLSELTRHPYPRFEQWAGKKGGEGPDGGGEGANFDESEWGIGECSKNEECTVTMISPTEFNVIGTVSGFIGTGTLGVLFNSPCLRFLLNPGGTGNFPGDIVRFKTSEKLANVVLSAGEFFTKGVIDLIFRVGGAGPRVKCV